MACAPSEDSDQPGHSPSLIKVFAVHMKKAWVLSYPLSAQRRIWSDWADAQADLSLCWVHSHFVGFVMRQLKCTLSNLFFQLYCKHIEPSHEIMVLFVLCKLILQKCMRSHSVGLDIWFLVGPLVYLDTLFVRTAKALARLRGCAGSPEPSLVAYVICTLISRAGSNYHYKR